MSSPPVRGEFSRHDYDEDEEEDEHEGGRELVAGPSSGRKRARISNIVPVKEEQDDDWSMEVEQESTGGGRELIQEEDEKEATRGWRMPAGSSRYGAGRSMGAMDFLSSRGRGMNGAGGGRRKGLMGAQGLASNGSFPFPSFPFVGY